MKHIIAIASLLLFSCNGKTDSILANDFKFKFNETNAYNYIKDQTDLGPRNYGSESHKKVREYFKREISSIGLTPQTHSFNAPYIKGRTGENIYAFLKGKSEKYIIIASHYDSRSIAEKDKDPKKRNKPISGANDGASSSGVLLELMRTFKAYNGELKYSIAFVLFDLEDDGNIFDIEYDNNNSTLATDWIQGSIAFVNDNIIPKEDIEFGILLDMVGDSNASFKFESYAHSKYSSIYSKLWETANNLGYSKYFKQENYGYIIDDHTPFLEAAIPFIDIIDMDYKYHHTQDDTIEKISTDTLKAVGQSVEFFIVGI